MHTKGHTFTLKGYLQNSEIRNRLEKISWVREMGEVHAKVKRNGLAFTHQPVVILCSACDRSSETTQCSEGEICRDSTCGTGRYDLLFLLINDIFLAN